MGRYDANPAFAQELLRSTGVKVYVDELTRQVADQARDHAAEKSQTIAASIDTDGGMTATGYRGRVNAWDFKSGWAEFGTSRFPQVRMLGRALEEIVGPVVGD